MARASANKKGKLREKGLQHCIKAITFGNVTKAGRVTRCQSSFKRGIHEEM